MKHGRRNLVLLATVAIALTGCASTEPDLYSFDQPVNAPADVSFFYDSLSPYGRWFEMPPYGWVWYPYDTPVGWRPYTVGYWTDTDYGWMWISEDPWGWAPYHYGRWAYDTYYGWIWIPGDVWAPAWVAWRYGDGWVGWAPLPPQIGWQVGVGLDMGSFDVNQGIDPYRWCFVHERDLLTTRIRTRVLPPSKNVTLVQVTKNVTSYGILKDRPVDHGVDPDLIQRVVDRPIPRYRLVEAQAPTRGRPAVIRGEEIQVYRPAVTDRTPGEKPRPLPPTRMKIVPPDAALKRQEAERRRFDATMERERVRLDQEQQTELKRPPPGITAEELRRRQQEELRAQQEREHREREAVDNRNQLLRKVVEERRQQIERQKEQQRLEQQQRQQQQKEERQRLQDQKRQQQEEKQREREKEKQQRQGEQDSGRDRDRGNPPTRDR